MLTNLSTPVRAAILYSLLFGSQGVVIAGLSFGWSPAAIITSGLVLVSLAGILFFLSVQMVKTVVGEFTRHAKLMSQGDLSHEIPILGGGESVGALRALKAMQEELRKTIGAIRSGSHEVSTASTEIATGNQDLSQRTEQTASNLQQTASSLSQLTGNVRQSADAAAQANQLASSATQVARRGGEVVSQVVSTMEEINSSSKKIADIIGVIDGIAFQTNILALNAAVEAARAGEQGRGFAVVAGEVRSLAQRSAEAAKEIKSLIGTSVDKVETGSKLVQDAGSTMSEIVASVQRVTDIIGEISAASLEQSQGIGQVNEAVNRLDQMTQQNAALVEQSAAAAESLKEQAHRMTTVVAGFRTASDFAIAPATKPAPVAHKPAASKPAASAVAAARPAAPKPAAAKP
ncbi:MAG TPA: methyl-accepting chemotaxis protein, partial [Burkholderiaceae bacterium]